MSTPAKTWKELWPDAAKDSYPPSRTGPISNREATPTREADPWQVGNHSPRHRSTRLANGGSISDYTYSDLLGLEDNYQLGLQQNEYPSATASAAAPSPFQVTHKADDIYIVQAGTCEGQLIPTQEIDVGSTRPVAILAYPQYLLSIYGGQYVWTASVKTGGSSPVLVSSASTLDDVTTVGATGTEARALIAYLDVDNNIFQITTGNIVGTFSDDGSLTGQISGNYNKNS